MASSDKPMSGRPFRIGLTADFYRPDDESLHRPRYRDYGLDALEGFSGITVHALRGMRPVVDAEQVKGINALVVLTPRITSVSVTAGEDLLAIARFGVGYDSVDVAACTAADVAVLIAAGAVDRSVAEATLTWMLALTHHVRAKDILVREGRWNERSEWMGSELRDRRLGVVGLGGIGKALVRLIAPFGMQRPLAYDPFASDQTAEELNVGLVDLDGLLARADFVSLHCPLNEHTRGLIGPEQLALMKPGSYLINTARGGLVDEDALYTSLAAGHLAGAAIDCFADEPLTAPHRFAELEHVLLAPHSIAWTDEMFRDIGRSVFGGLVELSQGSRPRGVVNPEVFERPSFQAKWARLRVES